MGLAAAGPFVVLLLGSSKEKSWTRLNVWHYLTPAIPTECPSPFLHRTMYLLMPWVLFFTYLPDTS